MDTVEIQDLMGKEAQLEVERLEIFLFGVKKGGWPATGLTLGKLRELAQAQNSNKMRNLGPLK